MKEWYEYDCFEDYWKNYLTIKQRQEAIDKMNDEGNDMNGIKRFWELQKQIELHTKQQGLSI